MCFLYGNKKSTVGLECTSFLNSVYGIVKIWGIKQNLKSFFCSIMFFYYSLISGYIISKHESFEKKKKPVLSIYLYTDVCVYRNCWMDRKAGRPVITRKTTATPVRTTSAVQDTADLRLQRALRSPAPTDFVTTMVRVYSMLLSRILDQKHKVYSHNTPNLWHDGKSLLFGFALMSHHWGVMYWSGTQNLSS